MPVMPGCDDIGLRMTPFLGGELEALEHATVQQHLDSCLTCRSELQRARAVERLLTESRPLPEDVRDRLERFAAALVDVGAPAE